MAKLVFRVTSAGRTFVVRRQVRVDSMSNFVEDSLDAACELGSLFNLPGEAFKVSISEGDDNGNEESTDSEGSEARESEAGAGERAESESGSTDRPEAGESL